METLHMEIMLCQWEWSHCWLTHSQKKSEDWPCAHVFDLSVVWNAHQHGGCFSYFDFSAAVTPSCLSQHVHTPWELSTYTIWTSNVGFSWTVSLSLWSGVIYALILTLFVWSCLNLHLSEYWIRLQFALRQFLKDKTSIVPKSFFCFLPHPSLKR